MKKKTVALLLAFSLGVTGIISCAQEEVYTEEAGTVTELPEPVPETDTETPTVPETCAEAETSAEEESLAETLPEETREEETEYPEETAIEELMEEETPALQTEQVTLEFDTEYFVNPDYEGILSEEQLDRVDESVTAKPFKDYYTNSLEEAGEELRIELANEKTPFTIRYFYVEANMDAASLRELMWEIWDAASSYTDETDDPLGNCGGWALSASGSEEEDGLYLDLEFTVTYMEDSAESEEQEETETDGYPEETEECQHLPGDWVTVKAATCTQDGTQFMFCTICDEILDSSSIPALGHEPVEVSEGIWICERCGVSVTETGEELPQTEETEDEETELVAEAELESESETEEDLPEFDTMYFVNPVYKGIISESDLLRADESDSGIATLSSGSYTTSIEEAGEELRKAMVNREVPFTIKYIYPGTSISNAALTDIVWDLWDVALEHTGVSTEGDYIRWQYGGWALSTSVSRGSQGMYLDMKFTVTFYTTYEEEQELTARLQSVFSSLNLGCKNDYERVCAIYDYICANVTYDYDHLYNSTYYKQYSAYGALINETAVCQGYAVLLYRMLLEAGVDCRVITGEGGGDAHAWNIVCLNGKYYNVDATWDAGRKIYTYFLLPDSSFSDHTKSSDYASSSFTRSYPMASSAYDPSENMESHHTPGDWITVEEATCTEDGLREKICTVCGEVVEEEVIPALGHDFSITETTDPGCETDGHVVKICSRCEHSEISEVLPATGHSYDKAELIEPTCLEGGYTVFICSVCGDTYVGDHTDPLGHHYVDASIQAKCTEPGETIEVCTRCTANYVAGFTDPLGHDFQDGVCTRCGVLQETEEPEHLHSYQESERVEATCEQSGWILFTCEGCGAIDTEEIPATGEHSYVEKDYLAPTCENHGSVSYICKICGDSYVDELEKTGHDFKLSDLVDPTCTEDGLIADICKNCGLPYEEILPALGHDPVKEENGRWICARCGEIVDPPETETPDTEEPEPEPQTESEELIPETLGLYDITEAEITGIGEHYEYTGEAVLPVPTVTYNGKVLTAGIDYLLEYSHDVEIGFASVAVVGIGDYYGEVTFHYTIETMIDINVEKEWNDDGDAYGHRPDSIEVELLSNGDETGITLTLGDFNDWTDIFTGLPKYKNDVEVEYTVKELSGEALQYYTPVITYQDDGSMTIVNKQEYFPMEEEILPDDADHDARVKDESVGEYSPVEFGLSTYLPFIDPEELGSGAFTMKFHGMLDSEFNLGGLDAGFSVYIAGNPIDQQYYTVSLDQGTGDGCSFHVDVDLTSLYLDGRINEEYLRGDTEIMVLFSADLEGSEVYGIYGSTGWYEVYDGGDLQYGSNEDTAYVYTYEIRVRKVDNSSDSAALQGAVLGLYYDQACTEPVQRNGEDYTGISGSDGLVVFDGLAEGSYYLKELEAPSGYVISDEVLKAVLGTKLDGYVYESVFENCPHTTEIRVEKEWVDNNNAYNTRPESITVTVTGSDDSIYTLMLNETNDWKATQSNLPLYDDEGKKITYTVTEETEDGYIGDVKEIEDGSYTITNTLKTVDVEGKKTWEDDDNADNNRPEFITINLAADGEKIDSMTVKPDENGDWSWSFTDLPKYQSDGITEVEYTFTEDPVTAYDTEVKYDTKVDAYIVTNTEQKTQITVDMDWKDGGDTSSRDSIEVQLKKKVGDGSVGEFGKSETLDSENRTYTWKDLPIFENGEEIAYSVEAKEIPGYAMSIGKLTPVYDENGNLTGYTITITETRTGETELIVEKKWVDSDNKYETRPESITVTVTSSDKEDENSPYTLTLKGNSWSAALSGLPLYDKNGEEITYTVEEVSVSGYTTNMGELVENGDGTYSVEITNTLETVDVEGTKTWEDDENADGNRPESITINLLADGEKISDSMTVKPDENGDWSWSFTDVPKYQSDGITEVKYTFTEKPVTAYDTEVKYDTKADAYIVTNTEQKTQITVDMDWKDGGDTSSRDSIEVQLKKKVGDGPLDDVESMTLDSENRTYTWKDLPIFENGEEIAYSVEAKEIDGYAMSIGKLTPVYDENGNLTGYTITITETRTGETEISVKKAWDDDDNADGNRPDSIKIHLFADGTEIDKVTVTADDDWTGSFTELPMYNEDGEEITYTVTEDAVTAYNTEVVGYDVTNVEQKIQITVDIDWKDDDDTDTQPDEITVQLLANGEPVGEPVKLKDSDNWTYTWENLPVFMNGEEIEYAVEAEEIDGYEISFGDLTPVYDEDGNLIGYILTVTITRAEETEETEDQSGKNDGSEKDSDSTSGSVKTADDTSLTGYLMLILFAIAALTGTVVYRRRILFKR